ncbi:MAG: hypothetical protein IJW15_01235 [Clostridia bacterium]|nr:hypothetical protein [Clostridia bacterium]
MLKKILLCFCCAALIIFAIFAFITKNEKPTVIENNTLIPNLTEQELILNSDLIVDGLVKDIGDSKWSNPTLIEGKRNILQTDIVVKINEIISGDYAPKDVVVRINKGYDKNTNTIVESDGYPDFSVGEHVILFLSRDDGDLATNEDYFVLTGMRQGKWSLDSKTDPAVSSTNKNNNNLIANLKSKVKEEKANNPNWKAQKVERDAKIIEDNKKLFGE